MNPTLSLHTWVSLPTEQRDRIRIIFKIPRSGNTVVFDGRVETDGTTPEDMKHLTIEKMQEYLEDESTDFHKLFDKVLLKINAKKIEAMSQVPTAQLVPQTPKRRGRPSSKNA